MDGWDEFLITGQYALMKEVNRSYDRAFQTAQDGWRWIFRGGGE